MAALATDLVADMKAGKTVFVQFSNARDQQDWAGEIVSACEDVLRLQNDFEVFRQLEIGDADTGPSDVLGNDGLSTNGDVVTFLTQYGFDPIAFCVTNPLQELDCWLKFFVSVCRHQKGLDHGQPGRLLMVFCIDEELPDILPRASYSTYQYWNAVRWEEMRLIAWNQFATLENQASQAWMVSTCVGASRHDPICLRKLCESKLRTLADVIKFSIEYFSDRPVRLPRARGLERQFTNHGSWKLPAQYELEWKTIGLTGLCLERGSKYSSIASSLDKRKQEIEHSIWCEQAAGLLPLVIEICGQVNRLLDGYCDNAWRLAFARYIDKTVDESYSSEPGKILDFTRGKQKLPRTVYELLCELRKSRNRLAHLEPIELSAINTIWDLHLRSQELLEGQRQDD